jgi:hypothetical protein
MAMEFLLRTIASEQEMSKSLVREYVEIIEDLAQTRKGSKG